MEKEPDEIVLKTSRIYFLGNYIIATLTITFLLLAYFVFNLKFTLFPKAQSELISTMIILGISAIAAIMIEQPEWVRYRTRYTVTRNEVMKEEGILNKHKIILPYQSVNDVRVKRNFIGRILNYGTVSVTAFHAGSDIDMIGIKYPQKVHEMVQNRVNMVRVGQMKFFGGKEEKEDKSEENKE